MPSNEPLSPTLTHRPTGEQHPYDPLPCERFPREPVAGESVSLGAETGRIPSADAVWCIWQKEGNPTQYRVAASKLTSGDTTDHWQVHLPAFNPNEEVHYRLFASSGDHQTESEEFTFSVSAWVDVVSIISVDENAETLNVILATTRPDLQVRLQAEPDQSGTITFQFSTIQQNGSVIPKSYLKDSVMKVWGELSITLSENPLKLEISRNSDSLRLQSSGPIRVLVRSDGTVDQYRLGFGSPRDEAFYGFGERFNALNQRGNRLDNHIYAEYTGQGKRSYIPVPFFISSRGYAVWLKTEQQAYFDMAASKNDCWTLTGRAEDDTHLEISFFFQDHPHSIVQAFTDLTGKPKKPPSWAFGLWMSSNDWNSQAEVKRQLQLAREHQIPATVLVLEAWSDESNFYIWNDSRYQQKPASQNYSLEDFTFPPAGRWPDPKTMIDELHQAGLHLVLWQIPVMKFGNPAEHLDETQSSADQAYAIQQKFVVQKADGSPHRIEAHSPWFANSLVLDFSNQKAVDWWFKKREYLLSELGVDGFKTDGGEHIWDTQTRFANGKPGSHGINTYPLEYEGAYDRFLRAHRLEDHVLFSRAGYAGIQKTSCHWTGDEKSTWEAFRASLRAMLNAGLCGVSFIGWDIAGFAGPTPGSDLYLRAAAFSVFCPIMQYHSDSNARREPSIDRTPWNIQEQTEDPDVIPIFRKFTNLRMNLVPYILNQAQESSQSGLPLMRSLFLEYPSDATGREFPYEYKFGNALLVAPVVDEGITSANVYLPEGDWSDFWSGKVYSGSQIVTIETPKDRIPVFQCKGSIVPLNLGETLELGSPVGNSIEEVSDLVLFIFPGEATRVEVFQGKDMEPLVVTSQLDAINDTAQMQLMGLKIPVDIMVSGYRPNEVRINGVVVARLEESDHSNAFWTWMLDRDAVHIHISEFQGAVTVLLSQAVGDLS